MQFQPLVLCYHAVSDRWHDSMAVSRDAIEWQLRWLKRLGYHSVEAGRILGNHRRTFHVTFDDAFRNVFDALPMLEMLGASVTVFACAGFADAGAPFWVDELAGRGPTSRSELETMDWQMLREAAERGVEIGSHTVSHPHLPELGERELAKELHASRERIEDELGRPCRFLAYPFGDHDARTRAAVRDAGYEAAFTLGADRRSMNPFALPRVDIYHHDGALRFGMKISPLRRPATALLARLRRQSSVSSAI